MADNGAVVARRPAESSPISNLLLHVGDDGTFRDGAEREDVADRQASVLAGVDELAGVHALVRDKGLGVELESVRITEDDFRKGSASARVVDDLLHRPSNVSMSFGEVEASELSGSLVEAGVGRKDGATPSEIFSIRVVHAALGSNIIPFPLVSNDATLLFVSVQSVQALIAGAIGLEITCNDRKQGRESVDSP